MYKLKGRFASPDDVKLTDYLKPKFLTFAKTFVYEFSTEVDCLVNEYAEDNKLEIRSISVCQTNYGKYTATVVFERGVER